MERLLPLVICCALVFQRAVLILDSGGSNELLSIINILSVCERFLQLQDRIILK